MKNIILLSGWKGSGKDFVSDILTDKFKYKRFGFADEVKTLVSEKYNIKRELFDTLEGKCHQYDSEHTYRDLLIKYAESKREDDVYYWARKVNKKIKVSKNNNIVISDWRFTEEIDYLMKETDYNITTIRINRFENSGTLCQTENSLNEYKFDYIIDNKNKSRDEIVKQIENILKN